MHLLNFYHKVSFMLERVHKNMVNRVDVFKSARKKYGSYKNMSY